MNNEELIRHAQSAAVNFQSSEDCHAGSVGAAILAEDGNIYTGLCIDVPSGMGFCAEHSAVAEMLKKKISKISCVVAANSNGKILAPCGRCREFMIQINGSNREAEVIVGPENRVSLGSLLPRP